MFLGLLLNGAFKWLGRIFDFVFSRRGLIIGGILTVFGLGGGGYWLWNNRQFWKTSSESWQASSQLWQAHAVRLEKDTVRLFAESARYQQLNAKLDKQAAEAVAAAADYREQYQQQVAVSDQNVDRLTANQQQLAYWKGLVANRTLSPTYIGKGSLLAGGDSAVTSAGLKTVNRAALTEIRMTKLEKAYAIREGQLATLKTANDRANQRTNNAVASSLYAEASWNREARTKRFLGAGRKKAARINADSVRTIREQGISDLEKALNHQTM